MTDSAVDGVAVDHAGSPRKPIISFGLITAIVCIAIVFLVVYPVAIIIFRTFFASGRPGLEGVVSVFQLPWLGTTLWNTFVLSISHGVLALLIGGLLAWLNERTDASLGIFGDVLPVIPLLIPSIAMAIGWIFLASPGAGFINGWLQPIFSMFGMRARIDVASWWGLIFIYTLNAVPYTYLIIASALRNLDPSLEEASRTSGASNWRTFRMVSMPAIKPAVLAAALLVVISGFTSFSVPLIIATRARIDILSVRMMRMITAEVPPRIDQATTLSVFLIIAVAIIWFYQRKLLRSGNFSTIAGKSARASRVILGRWRYVAWAFIAVYVLCAVVLPLFAILVVALQPFWQSTINLSILSFDNFRMILLETPLTRDAFVNSIRFSLIGATIAIAATTIIAVKATRTTGRLSSFLDGITKLPAALSHLALAIGFLVAFSTAPFYLAGTATMLILIYVVMCLPEASIMVTAAASQVGRELVEASRTSGATEGRTFLAVSVPLMLPGIMSGFAIVFVLMAGEVTASSLLAKPGQPVIGYALRDIWENGSFGGLSALAATFTLLNLVVVTAALLLGRIRKVK